MFKGKNLPVDDLLMTQRNHRKKKRTEKYKKIQKRDYTHVDSSSVEKI